jgi:phosphohistidine phosphatase
MILYFLRHGVAGGREEWKGDDTLRPLTKKGMKNMVSQAKCIDEMDLKLDLIVTSPLARAFQTADIVADELEMGEKLVQDERLGPGFGIDDLVEVLQDYPDASNIMLVGHEPDFSQTISALIGGGRLLVKKGGLARIDVINADPLQGELVWLLPPWVMIR